MAQLKIYRCWHKDGSARLVSQTDHRSAAEEAQELAGLQNADMPGRGSARDDPAERRRYLDACRVVKTECLTDGTEKRWKA